MSVAVVGPPGGASIKIEVEDKQSTSQVAEMRKLQERHATSLAHAAHVEKQKKKALGNIKAYLRTWMGTTVVDSCDQEALLEIMRTRGIAERIDVLYVTEKSPFAPNIPGLLTYHEILMFCLYNNSRGIEVVIDRPGHVLHACKLVLSYENRPCTNMLVHAWVDKAYHTPSVCSVQ
jgi:hypothetical protein